MSNSEPATPSPADKFAHLLNQPAPAKPKRAVGPKTRVFLVIVLTLFSLLLANGIYLSAITFAEWWTAQVYQNYFYQFMFLGHLVLGVVLLVPFIIFGIAHWKASHHRRNRRAVRIGYALLIISIVLLVSGLLLMRLGSFDLKQPTARRIVYWAHVIAPLVAIWFYWLHRLVGPRIKWYVAGRIAMATAVAVGAMVIFQMQDPRKWNQSAPKEGDKYFQPSLARTRTGNFISSQVLMNDDYCKSCHPDVYDDWVHSAHRFSSFNNPAYLYAVRETRKVVSDRDGTVQASRWCAGCHDPVPFFSGAFDSPTYDDVNHVTSQAGITCTVCHAITHVNSTKGNADYVIEEPVHYPFTYSKNNLLQQVNQLLVKAKPSFHKAEMLKPIHKTEEFCSTCHKVHLPKEVTAYKDFLRGQNHYDSFLLSGVGHGARSFYYPPKAEDNCNRCHMPWKESNDFGATDKNPLGKMAVHNHFFPGANTALPYWRGEDKYVDLAKSLLVDCVRVDIFGVREGGVVDGKMIAPIRPQIPTLEAGKNYLLESVIRTLKMGHHLTQGTVDSNELWLEVTARSGDRVIGMSGGQDELGQVDEWAHFVNNFVLDKNGNRISRRNAQDIFVALYDHQIPPGSGQVAHYSLEVPADVTEPIEVTVKLNYRKFDKGYIDFMNSAYKEGDRGFKNHGPAGSTPNPLPITVMAQDKVVFGIKKSDGTIVQPNAPSADPPKEEWQRWNDYGIGMLLTGKAQLRQAYEAFSAVEELKRFDGPLNLARVYLAEGNLDAATEALSRASKMDPPPPAWTFAWLSGEVARQQGHLEDAELNFRAVLYDKNKERRDRNFDFSKDYIVRNLLGSTLLDLYAQADFKGDEAERDEYLEQARLEFLKVLEADSENVSAHFNLSFIYERMGREEEAAKHRQLNLKYKPDDNAAEQAKPKARELYPAADHAAEQLVIYSLNRKGAPGLTTTPPAAPAKADAAVISPNSTESNSIANIEVPQ
jgi:tetratricopeptide (TPR) repeat protein